MGGARKSGARKVDITILEEQQKNKVKSSYSIYKVKNRAMEVEIEQ